MPALPKSVLRTLMGGLGSQRLWGPPEGTRIPNMRLPNGQTARTGPTNAMWSPARAVAPVMLRQLMGRPTPWNNARQVAIAARPTNPRQDMLIAYLLKQKYGPRG